MPRTAGAEFYRHAADVAEAVPPELRALEFL
jgi:hypothetical protein